jgi:hypothetical protein
VDSSGAIPRLVLPINTELSRIAATNSPIGFPMRKAHDLYCLACRNFIHPMIQVDLAEQHT